VEVRQVYSMRGGGMLRGWLDIWRCFGVGRLQSIGNTAEQLNRSSEAQCMQVESLFLAAVAASTAGSVAFRVIVVVLLVPIFRGTAHMHVGNPAFQLNRR
jgi:hypothetical protein